MKVFALTQSYVGEEEALYYAENIGVYSTKEKAQARMNELFEEEKKKYKDETSIEIEEYEMSKVLYSNWDVAYTKFEIREVELDQNYSLD